MKKSIVWIVLFTFALTSFGFTQPTSTPAKASDTPAIQLKIDSAVLTENFFPQQLYHTSKTISPIQFEFEKADFATDQWSKLIQSVYVQQTDISFILTSIAVTGAVMQETLLSNDALQTRLKEISEKNTVIKTEATTNPKSQFIPFYDTVYKTDIYTVYSDEAVSYAKLSSSKLEEKYPDYVNKVSMSYAVYKKGSAFILMNWVYPNLNWESNVYMSLSETEKALNTLLLNNQEMLVTILNLPVIAKTQEKSELEPVTPKAKVPVPLIKKKEDLQSKQVIYVLVILKNKTYLLQEFKTQKEATAFTTASIKKYGKNAVKQFDDKKKLDALIKQLKLTKAKVK